MHISRPTHATTVAYLALFMATSGTAVAATGGSLILGRSNSAAASTSIRNTGTGPALTLGTAKTTTVPFSVGSNQTKVPYLNADKLDGLDSTALQRRVASTCGSGAVTAISASGGVTCRTTTVTSTRGYLTSSTSLDCPAGDTVISGGFNFTPDGFLTDSDARIIGSYPSDSDTWKFVVTSSGGHVFGDAYITCSHIS
jgi:hypothetical protein